MPESEFILSGPENIVLSGEAAEKLINAHDGNSVLLYIYILKRHGRFSGEEAAESLKLPPREISRCMKTLFSLGLVSSDCGGEKPEKSPRPAPADELPEYTIQDVRRELREGAVFSALVKDVQRSLGKILSSEGLMKLFGIYDSLGLPPEVILMLVTYCIEECHRKYGPQRMPTMRYIEKAAYTWERAGIFTLEKAEEYINAINRKRKEANSIKHVLQIRDREFSVSEKKYVNSWLDMGFRADAAEIAYDRTVLKTGRLAWSYMNSIFKSWHEKGLHTAEEIARGDTKQQTPPEPRPTPPGQAVRPQTDGSAPTSGDLRRIQKMLENIKGSR